MIQEALYAELLRACLPQVDDLLKHRIEKALQGSENAAGGAISETPKEAVLWAVNRVYESHSVRRRVRVVSNDTLRRLERLARERFTTPPGIARAALLGYVCRHGIASTPSEPYDAYRYWTLQSVIRPAHADENLAAYEEAMALGHDPEKPWKQGWDVRPPRRETPKPTQHVRPQPQPVQVATEREWKPGEFADALRQAIREARRPEL